MHQYRPGALIAGLILALAVHAASPAVAAEVQHIGSFTWKAEGPDFGGFSGLEIAPNGEDFHAVSDRGTLHWGRLLRDADGTITGVADHEHTRLQDGEGKPLPPDERGDAEGLAMDAQNRLWVSFEGNHRIARYDSPDHPAHEVESYPDFAKFDPNAGFEGLAIAPDGAIIAVLEQGGDGQHTPIWRWTEAEGWDQPWTIPSSGKWLPVGADFGPDGRLYILDRQLVPLGFASRVRRFDWSESGPVNEQEILHTVPRQHDNLEGIAIWHDGQHLRITMISDDNFIPLQRTELVEYRIIEDTTPQP